MNFEFIQLSKKPLKSLSPGNKHRPTSRRSTQFASIEVPGEEEAGPLGEIGITPDDTVRSDGTVNYLHPDHWQSGALWAYIVIIIIVAIIILIMIRNRNGGEWYASLNAPASLPLASLLAIWAAFFVIFIIVGYVSHTEATDEGLRLQLTWVFIINMGLIIIWALFFFHQQDIRAGFFLAMLTLAAAIWWTIVMWQVNSAMAILLLIYTLWVFYQVWAHRLILLNNSQD